MDALSDEKMTKVARQLLRLTAAFLLVVLVPVAKSDASEGGFVPGPIGGSDIRAALLPPPGTYLLGFPNAVRNIDFRDNDGQRAPFTLSGGSGSLVLGLGHVFETPVLGGHVAVAGTTFWGEACLRVQEFQRSQCTRGWGDTYAEVFWSRRIGELPNSGPPADDPRRAYIPYGLTVAASLGGVLPTGRYSSADLQPLGLNTAVFVPSVAGTLTLPPLLGDATEISGRLFYAMHGRNDATRYQAGDMVILDWALSERIGRFQVGAVGSFARQVEADRIADQPGPTTSVTAFGGVVAMDLPEFGAFLSLKAQRDVEASWRLRRDAIGLRIGVRL